MKNCMVLLIVALTSPLFAKEAPSVHMANGIKIGEVTSTSAIIWTRLTQNSERNLTGLSWPTVKSKKSESHAPSVMPKGQSLADMQDAVPGASGDVRVSWSLDGKPAGATEWLAVDSNKDFTRQIQLTSLAPGKRYAVTVSSRSSDGTLGQAVTGTFQTAPTADQVAPVRFTVVTGQEFSRRDDAANGHKIYTRMLALDPHFFVHTGDIVYYDYSKLNPKATDASLARHKWNRMYALPFQRTFHNAVGSYFIKDDHDTLKNDCSPGQTYGDLTWEEGLAIFREQVPMVEKTYRTIRRGKDLQIWLVEGRDFRSPKDMPDGPEKTIWGPKQKQWFFDTVEKSDATFRILISPTPIVGPDRKAKNDNHANAGFTHEGDELRDFIGKQKNMFVICGDRHWQYVSEDPNTSVREYSCGPTSDKHAGGFSEKQRSPMLRYLKVTGGFLAVVIERDKDGASAVLSHYGVDGAVYNRDVMKAK
jgi:alkaline phosphatase D